VFAEMLDVNYALFRIIFGLTVIEFNSFSLIGILDEMQAFPSYMKILPPRNAFKLSLL